MRNSCKPMFQLTGVRKTVICYSAILDSWVGSPYKIVYVVLQTSQKKRGSKENQNQTKQKKKSNKKKQANGQDQSRSSLENAT